MKENRERKKAANALEGKTKKKEPTAAELAAFEQGPAGQYIKKVSGNPLEQLLPPKSVWFYHPQLLVSVHVRCLEQLR